MDLVNELYDREVDTHEHSQEETTHHVTPETEGTSEQKGAHLVSGCFWSYSPGHGSAACLELT